MQINLSACYRGKTWCKQHYGNVTTYSSPLFAFLYGAAEVEMVVKITLTLIIFAMQFTE